jgi:hypothetical protein
MNRRGAKNKFLSVLLSSLTFPLFFPLSPTVAAPTVSDTFTISGPLDVGSAGVKPVAASNGTNFLVAWNNGRARGLGCAVIDSGGAIISRFDLPILSAGGTPAVASDGMDFLLVWGEWVDSSLHARRISGDGALLPPGEFAITQGLGGEPVQIAWNGTNYLVVWEDGRLYPTNQNIAGILVSRTGAVDNLTNPIPICSFSSNQSKPAVASDGSGFFVVWEDNRNSAASDTDIYGTRLDGGGNVLDPGGIPVCTNVEFQQFPAVASNGRDYLVTWQDRRNVASSGWDVFAAHIGRDGATGGGFLLGGAPRDQDYPTVAACGEQYLVCWRDWSDGESNNSAIRGTRVRDLTLLDPAGLTINNSPDIQDFPKLVYGSDGRFLALNATWTFANQTNYVNGNLVSIPGWEPKLFGLDKRAEGLTLSWFAEQSRTYRVQFRTSLTDGTWQDLPGDVTATGSVATKLDGNADSQRFYRVVRLP